MKVYVSKKPVAGPWGGGNKFVCKLIEKLKEVNTEVTFNLTKDVDVIFCFDPRPNKQGLWFLDYYNHKKELGTKIIQRVGDIGTHSKPELNELVKQSTQISDFIIFPSVWSKDTIGYKKSNFKIIPNAPLSIFHQNKKKNHSNSKTKKIVTHHWSTNKKKGFDHYKYLGDKIHSGDMKGFEFTYIGRYNTEFISKGIRLIEPMNETDLSKILPSFDIYLTASIEEAGANHVLEAMAAGLPVVYRNVGCSISEYCKNYGSGYTSKDEMVNEIMSASNKQYPKYTETIDDVIKEYVELICKT